MKILKKKGVWSKHPRLDLLLAQLPDSSFSCEPVQYKNGDRVVLR